MAIHKVYVAPPIPMRKKSSGSDNSTGSYGYYSREGPGLNEFMERRNAFLTRAQQNARQQVQAEFITQRHMSAIEKASREGNFAGSFRAAGGPTLAALDRGAAAKGHNILEKTIKLGSLKNVYGEARAPDLLKQAQSNGLAGMVGAWGGPNKTISGVYVHNKASQAVGELKDEVFPLSLEDTQSIQRYHEAVKGGDIIPYTGDYDMHDIIQFSAQSHQGHVPEADGHEEIAIKDRINREIAEVDPGRPFESEPTNVIRHGPQVNFVPHMWGHEKDDVIKNGGYLGVVANMGEFPVAFVNRGNWEIIKHWPALYRYYMENNTKIPKHWQAGGLHHRNTHFVATDEHAEELDNLK